MSSSQKLLAWYKKNGRDLPWRKTRDAYKILVSEMMLQQTQVPRVLSYYKKWLRQFPSWKALAKASNADVIRAWAGLGYNRRALALRDIAKQVVERGLPKDRAGWESFKGIGPYTSSALAIFSLGERVMPIDTNIRRVLGRLLLGEPFPTSDIDAKLLDRTQELLKRVDFDQIPQALFDLATIVCKKQPDCAACPLRDVCPAADLFLKDSLRAPKRTTPKSNEKIHRNKKYPDRIYRGRILQFVREHPTNATYLQLQVTVDNFDPALDAAWFQAMLDRLVKDEMIVYRKNRYVLLG